MPIEENSSLRCELLPVIRRTAKGDVEVDVVNQAHREGNAV